MIDLLDLPPFAFALVIVLGTLAGMGIAIALMVALMSSVA
jgi:hypothetical protein